MAERSAANDDEDNDVFARPRNGLPMLVRALWSFNRLYARAYHHVRVLTPCPIGPSGGGIVICNHSAGLDPVILQATCPRFLTWMMAKEYYDLPILKPVCKRLGYIPVTRGGRDAASLKAALRALAAGRVLGVFPEGRIEPTLDLMPLQPGVVMLAARARVPLYPAYIAGMRRNLTIVQDYLEPQELTVAYGEPFHPPGNLADGIRLMQERLERLKHQCLANRLPLRQSAPKNLDLPAGANA